MKNCRPPSSPPLLSALSATLLGIAAALLPGCNDRPPDFYSGYAEADYVRIASPIGGSLSKLYLQRGDQATANAPAFVLEQDSERAAREEASARLQRAQAQLSDLNKGKRPDEIAALQAQLAEGHAALTLANADLARQQQLQAAHFVSPAQLDSARAAVEREQARGNDLRAQIRVAQLGARSDAIAAARQDIKTAEAQLAQADWKLVQKTQRTITAGEVADVLYREGEWVPAGSPVISLLPPQNIKARFFVPQAVLGSLHIGQHATLQCDGCAAPIAASISFIATQAEYTSPLIYSKENRATLVFMIEARPAPAAAIQLHPGQPLEIRLSASGGQPASSK
jgi:HlyD family secretion protein